MPGTTCPSLGRLYERAGAVGATLSAATVGGALAKISDGWFANAAITALFWYVFNDLTQTRLDTWVSLSTLLAAGQSLQANTRLF
jgi:hypothetical protein